MKTEDIIYSLEESTSHTRILCASTKNQVTDRILLWNILHNQAIIMEALNKILKAPAEAYEAYLEQQADSQINIQKDEQNHG